MFRPVSLRIKNLASHRDTYYEFKQGIPQLIFGQNLDDPGQKGNGSGKSGFIEAICLAITGNSIRTKYNRRLITRDEEELFVEFILTNIKTNKDLVIRRKVFKSEHKSGECEVKYGTEDIVKGRVTDYTTWILEEIGISEEDFKTYYLITMESYKPFFSLTDIPKKAIVNRFSGANKVDDVDVYIKHDSMLKEKEICEVQTSLTVEKSIREVLINQKTLLLKRVSPEYKQEQIQSKTNTLNLVNNTIKTLENTLTTKYTEEATLMTELEVLKLEVDEVWKREKDTQLLSQSMVLNKLREEKTLIISKFAPQYLELKTKVLEQEKAIGLVKHYINNGKVEISKLKNQIEASIECPKCSHEFVLRDETFDVLKAKNEKLPELLKNLEKQESNLKDEELKLKGFDEEKKSLQKLEEEESVAIINKISDQESVVESIKVEMQQFNLKKQKVQTKQIDLTNKSKEIQGIEDEYKVKVTNVENLETDIVELEKDSTVDTSEIDQKYLSSEEKTEVLKTSFDNLTKEKQEIDAWLVNFKNFKSELANKSIKNIQDYTSLYLKSFGTNLSVKLEGYRTVGGKLKEEIDTVILRDGFPIDTYDTFSRGERTRVDLANIIGQQELINLNAKNGLDLLICDEILDSFDSLGIELIMKSILDLGKTIFIVSQIEVNSLKENTLHFVKENKVTKVVSV